VFASSVLTFAVFELGDIYAESCALLLLLLLAVSAGDTSLRVSAAVSYMLVTRAALPAPLVQQPEVLSGRWRGGLSWWLGLANILYARILVLAKYQSVYPPLTAFHPPPHPPQIPQVCCPGAWVWPTSCYNPALLSLILAKYQCSPPPPPQSCCFPSPHTPTPPGVLSWWLGLADILYAKPGDWAAVNSFLFIKDYFSTAHAAPSVSVSDHRHCV
jgi:hypothetical protein